MIENVVGKLISYKEENGNVSVGKVLEDNGNGVLRIQQVAGVIENPDIFQPDLPILYVLDHDITVLN